MVLSIKDPEADRLARQLARMTGKSITEAVKAALRNRLEHEQRRRGKHIDRARIAKIVADIGALPVVDERSPDELIGYDDFGDCHTTECYQVGQCPSALDQQSSHPKPISHQNGASVSSERRSEADSAEAPRSQPPSRWLEARTVMMRQPAPPACRKPVARRHDVLLIERLGLARCEPAYLGAPIASAIKEHSQAVNCPLPRQGNASGRSELWRLAAPMRSRKERAEPVHVQGGRLARATDIRGCSHGLPIAARLRRRLTECGRVVVAVTSASIALGAGATSLRKWATWQD